MGCLSHDWRSGGPQFLGLEKHLGGEGLLLGHSRHLRSMPQPARCVALCAAKWQSSSPGQSECFGLVKTLHSLSQNATGQHYTWINVVGVFGSEV